MIAGPKDGHINSEPLESFTRGKSMITREPMSSKSVETISRLDATSVVLESVEKEKDIYSNSETIKEGVFADKAPVIADELCDTTEPLQTRTKPVQTGPQSKFSILEDQENGPTAINEDSVLGSEPVEFTGLFRIKGNLALDYGKQSDAVGY
ncbi:hypothetical protein NADFUDRAFT_49275 [Nadsonia fulvescens var. elongata DSM 6958]|uniref:Uncharacterized protein n=1 Tax=Nadsonia fulvescens var. elongata DSM 6958 TaxID=857566 RepID=A0A1E3PT78_9ASCO|nr:hypothetical protein NADFUDRAFT_49275 [Nadsonia fulvescens var. elongata DSM 6958]